MDVLDIIHISSDVIRPNVQRKEKYQEILANFITISCTQNVSVIQSR